MSFNADVFRSELLPGEEVLWAGQPDPTLLFTPSDLFLVPFSLLWGGFAIFWELTASGLLTMNPTTRTPPLPFSLFGIPFVLIGLYFIVGRFFYKTWRKRKTWYAVTNRRVLVISNGPLSSCQSALLESIPSINKSVRANGYGTIRFGNSPMMMAMYQNTGMDFFAGQLGSDVPTFFDIKDADAVYRLVNSQRK